MIKDTTNQTLVQKTLSHLLDYGAHLEASLITIEHSLDSKGKATKQFNVNYRTTNDNVNFLLPDNLAKEIINNIKSIAGITSKQNEGQLTVTSKQGVANYNVTVFRGPKIVLQPQEKIINIPSAIDLGFEDQDLNVLKQTIVSGKGLIVFLGTRTSGKTTTIYSLLQAINSPQLNITTIEKKPKRNLSDINQIHRHYQLDVNQLLRSLAVKDADVLYLSDLDDELDLSTLANLASSKLIFLNLQATQPLEAFEQLRNIKSYDQQIVERIKLLVNQRLVKKNCQHCRQANRLDYYTLDDLHNQFDLDDTKTLGHLDFYQGQGCSRCGYSGHQGQTALFELTPMTKSLLNKLKENNPEEIEKDIANNDNNTLFENAFAKAVQGHISIAEIQRLF